MSEQVLRVLLLDDEASLREPLAKHLRENYNYTVDTVADGTQAMRLVEDAQGRYDVALIDEALEEGPSGFEVLKQIKSSYPDIEVILFTGWGMGSAIEALRAGAYRYFAKPFNPEELALMIRFAAEQGQARREQKILSAFHQVTTAISSTLELNEILRRTCQAAVDLFGVDHSGLVRFDEDYTQGRVVAEYPEGVTSDGQGTMDSVIPVRGIPAEERLVYRKEVLNIPDVGSEASLGPVCEVLLCFGIRSVLIVPVVLQDRVVASFSLDAIQRTRMFYQNEIGLCQSLANQAAIAIANAQLYREAEEGRTYLESLYEASIQIISPRDPVQVLQDIVDNARRATGARQAVTLVFDEKEKPRVLVTSGVDHELDPTRDVRQDGVSVHVVRSGQPYLISDTAAPDQLMPPNPGILASGIRAAACIPFMGRNKGVLWVQFGEVHAFSENELRALQLFANQSAIAYDNARRIQELEHMRAATDAMASAAAPKEVLQQIVKSATRVLGADHAVISSYDAIRDIFFPEELVAENVPAEWLERFRQEELETGRTTRHVLKDGYVRVTDLSTSQAEFLGEPSRTFLEALGVKSFQGIRLDVGDETEPLGVLYVDYREPRDFTTEEQRILEHFANHAALILKRARLLDHATRLREAARVVAKVSTLGQLEDTLESIVRGARDVLRCDIATLYTFNETTRRFVHAKGLGCMDPRNMRPPEQVTGSSALWKIIDLKERYYHPAEAALDDDFLQGRFVRAENIRSTLGVQLRFGERRVGVMFISYRTPHRFTDDEIKDALQFGDQAAVAIRNAQLHDETIKRTTVLEVLYEAGKTITSTLTLDATLRQIAEQALHIIGASCQREDCFSHVALLEDDKLRFIAASSPEILDTLHRDVAELDIKSSTAIGIAGRAAKTGQSQCVPDVSQDQDYISPKEHTKSQLSVPLKAGEQVIGVLSIEHPEEGAFTEQDVQNVQLLAAQATVAIQNARLYGNTQRLLESRTALAWTGMISSTWRHTIEKHAVTVREQVQLLRRDLERSAKPDSIARRLDMVERLANQILEKPLTPPLTSDEGVQSVPVNNLVHARTKQLWSNEPYKSICLKQEFALEDSATIRASPEWLRRAFDVLIDNAVEAMAGLAERNITLITRRVDNRAEVCVIDNGRGIPEEIRPRLFNEPIKKSKGAKGHGMGLLFAQTIIQTYGGEIRCASTSPSGTTMVISLPLEL